ncbi:MAG: chemotaxis protein [Cyanobacteria bacterium]|nr:chemotaxis protein [Cyanobacteriota bacterium]MDW8199761.1 chemotaxis protein [Cyanobacteriota bacterium SKYGB_h_bin112]
MNIPDNLTPSSTLADLPLHECKVDSDTLGEVVAAHFEQQPTLPGVIVVNRSQLLGVISWQSFQRRMMKPFALEIFLKRPLKIFFGLDEQSEPQDFLQLNYTEKVIDAVPIALSRPVDRLYDPILVVFQNENLPDVKAYFLLDCQTLMTAQSQILTVANQQIRDQQRELKRYLSKLESERQKVKDYAQKLEKQQSIIQERNQLLEAQQKELVQRSEEVAGLNQRFVQIGQLLSMEGKKAFQATFAGVNAICRSTSQIVSVGQSLSEELNTLHEASQLVAKVSQQVRYLAVKAGIGASRSSQEISGFSTITTEISNLVSQTFEAGRQMDRVASRFKLRIQELTDAAQSGTATARSLVSKIQQAEIALAELESLVYQQDRTGVDGADADSGQPGERASDPWISTADTEALIQRITRAETMLSELKEMVHRTDNKSIVTKIQHTLDLHQQSAS